VAGPRGQQTTESPGAELAYPLSTRGDLGSTPADHKARAVGNWYSDNAVDISTPDGTGTLAVDGGVIGSVTIRGQTPSATVGSGSTVFLTTEDDEWSYMHLTDVNVSSGDRVTKGQKIGTTGTAANVPHLHLGRKNGNPMDVLDGTDMGTGGVSNGGGGATSNLDEGTAKAAAFATYFNIEGLFDTLRSQKLIGEKSLMNDQPLMPLIQQMCSASLRRFQSMPNGNFFAFYPDYFGGSNHRQPYWEISDMEIIDGQIDLNDNELATHVFVVGDNTGNYNGIDLTDMDNTAGVINIFNAFQADFLTGHGDQQEDGPDGTDRRIMDHDEAVQFLKKYGARPYYEEAAMVRSAFYEAFLAFQKFCLLWSKQFATTFTLTFMPELFPGGLVAFPQHNLQLFVEAVEHSFDYETGFVTQVTFSSPASLDRKGKEHEGMIRAGALNNT
jgi:hypothetical protein